jgi:hypothetical protein
MDHQLLVERDRADDRLIGGRHEQLCPVQPSIQIAQVGDVHVVQGRTED